MGLTNNANGYGWVSITMHWLIAVGVFGLFVLGLWMTGLDYYHAWYRRAPDIHRSVGALLAMVLLFRLFWRLANPTPVAVGRPSTFVSRLAGGAHWLLVLLPLLIVVSGYLISTADGRALAVFDWFEIPALVSGVDNLEDRAGDVHYVLSLILIVLAAVHALAALKHHFLDHDATLRRMVKPTG
jgi:cytochrome b561